MLIFAALLALHTSLAGTVPAVPENITVTFLNPQSVRISWQTSIDIRFGSIEKFLVTYKPTNNRVVHQVAGNSEAIVLNRLTPSTQYQLTVTAFVGGKKFRSRQIIFKTLDSSKSSLQQDPILIGSSDISMSSHGVTYETDITGLNNITSSTRELPTIRGVEIGIVLLVLAVWAGAIALFFNRWGKIRMLLPYQPDYKQEQLKVPGGAGGACNGSVCNGQHSHQHFHYTQDEPSTTISERCTRSRINSAIFVSSEGHGFDSIEFLRRHGSQSVLCRKARSAENVSDGERKRYFSENQEWSTEDSQHPNDTIELVECHKTPSTIEIEPEAIINTTRKPSIVAQSNLTNLAVVTTSSSKIVGSISIESTPPTIENTSNLHQPNQQKSPSTNRSQTAVTTTTAASTSNTGPRASNFKNSKPKLNPPKLSVSGPSPSNNDEELL